MNRKTLAFLLAAGIATGIGGSARAQDAVSEETKARMERLEKQRQETLLNAQRLQEPFSNPMQGSPQLLAPAPNAPQGSTLSPADIRKMLDDYYKEKEDKKKADDAAAKAKAEEEGYKIGSDLKMTASWKNGLWLETANKDFTMHVGGWIQYDNEFWDQSSALRLPADGRPGAKQGVASGPALGGIGDMQDGTFFRRIRLMTDGTFWECYEFNLILALENNQFSTIGVDEFWVGAKEIPLIGTARIGHTKNAIGFEGDMTASSRTMTFMERSSYSEAIELNQNFITGLWLGDNYFCERATYSFVVGRYDLGGSTGVLFGDGQYGMQGRLTALPIWEEDGRCWTHVGVSGGWRANTNNIATSPLRTVQIRARPELRDDDPSGNPGGAQPVPNANDARLVDTGVIASDNTWLLGFEYCSVWGPLSLQAEYGFTWVEDATGIAPSGFTLNPKLTSPQQYFFNGGYVQLAYTLTGENRAYDKRLGRLNTNYFGAAGPYNNAWFVRGDDGCYNCNWGAWEIAARYSYINLNDGVGLNRIQGGVMNGYSLGLNWYLNANLKFQFDYVLDQRSDLPADGAAGSTIPGSTRGLGMRMQFMY